MFDIEDMPSMFAAWKTRYTARDERMRTIDEVIAGDFSNITDPDEEGSSVRSPNFIQVALEDTAEASALVPTIRVQAFGTGAKVKQSAAAEERIATAYFEAWGMKQLLIESTMDLAAFGFATWVVIPDPDEHMPMLEKRDPRHCYPEPGWRPGTAVQKCLFAREIYLNQLPEEYKQIVTTHVMNANLSRTMDNKQLQSQKVVIAEYFSCDEIVCAALYGTTGKMAGQTVSYLPVELYRIPLKTGICPVILGSRFTLDGEFRGQFDQVVNVLKAHIRLMSMVLDYADQAVYSDIFVSDLIGEIPYGGGGYIELGVNGKIGRVAPAVPALSVVQDLQMMEDSIHLGGRWPKSRPGQIDQAIASAKFLEATAGMMNTVIRTYHTIFQNMLEKALRQALKVDKTYFAGKKRTVSGVLYNQQFVVEYDPSDIMLTNRISVEYGLGFGRDPAQTAVLNIQYNSGEYISRETVQENIDGIIDVKREQQRIDSEKLKAMMFAKLLQMAQQGAVSDKQLIDFIEARERGDDLIDVYKKVIVAPQEEQLQSGLPEALPGGPPGMSPPGQPPAGPAPAPPPSGGDLLARLGVPAGNSQSLLGSEVRS